jgi:ABC-type dipeptide/oligopeptide/nickel transport system ATPase component
MSNYTRFLRGSEWRKWDLHIHTPETKKHDRFEGSTPQEKWEKYIEAINNSPEDISVIGITDYFCVENYFKFKNLISEGTITKNFDLILPNIEIRVLPVTGSATPINLHCIFNPEIDSDIENRFLAKLKFNYSGSDYSAKKEELIRLGKTLPGNSSLDNVAALKAGIAQYVVTIETLRTIFEKDARLRENTIIIVSNKSTDGASGIRKHEDFFVDTGSSQLDATRWSLYQFSDAIFSSNPNDVLYFLALGPDSKETVIEKCGTLMPCFHGCDAHENNKIFKPDDNRFCWIKADPTFEGLKQTIYEPEDRVKIQAFQPDIKNERFILSELQFIDTGNLFGTQKILLNENLNAIIGGKSSGKSLLLYSTAKSIDPDQVNKTSKRLNFEGYKFDTSFNFEVTWKNREKDILNDSDLNHKLHKITYIPQLYINYLVEKNNKEELNALIKSILLQDVPFKSFFEKNFESITEITVDIGKLLNNYLQVRARALSVLQKSNELGKSNTISKGMKKIETSIAEGQRASNLNKEEFEEYNRLITFRSTTENNLKLLDDKDVVINKVLNEVISVKENLLGNNDSMFDLNIKGQIDRILDELTEIPSDLIAIRKKIEQDYDSLLFNLKTGIENLKIEENRNLIKTEIDKINQKLIPYLEKIAGQNELKKLTAQLEVENGKLQQALNLEKQIQTLLLDYENIRKQTVSHLKKRYELYKEVVVYINTIKNSIGSEISLTCSLLFKKENFMLFEQANKASIPWDNYFNTLFSDGLVNYDLIPNLYANALRVVEDKLVAPPNLSIPLKQKITIENVLGGLVADAFEFDYTVTYKGDDLLNMSPGKKGTVLLILFIQISSAEYPILIDQPEDNLDNRTIYELLCKMIKQKKKERQIIIVSHNANLVVATDAENIIVANQEGQGSALPSNGTRFEYVNGSIEHSFQPNISIISILKQQGIKEHVCDILEGGDEAFKQRERKYAIK